MKTRYDDETLSQINDSINLLDYASNTMEFTERNGEFWAHCPLHVDKTPSLSINPEKNTYYCFSCGRSGKAIGFLMDYEKLSFEEAVEKASKLADLDLTKMCHSQTILFLKRMKGRSCRKKEKYKHPILPPDTIKQYKKKPITLWLDEDIRQDVMDLFDIRIDERSNRIVYPVWDIDGNLINIKGRTMYPNYKELGLMKYINYEKVGVVDYFQGLNITKKSILEKREIIIFESIKSVMKAYGWGYKNCASAEKHTLTPEQISILIKLGCDVVFAYDADVDYKSPDVKANIDTLRRVTNVFVIEDRMSLLGGAESKNAPVDCGVEIWEKLYANKRKVIC